MSHEATTWAWKAVYSRKDIPATRRMVLLALAECHNGQTGQCNPSFDELVRMTGMKRDTITSSIRGLEQSGLMTINRGHGVKSSYQLAIQTSAEMVTSPEIRTSPENGLGVVPKSGLTSKPGKNPERIDKPPLTPRSDVGDLFARFWAAYPKKLSKGQAERTFAQLKPNEQLLAEILLGLQRAMTSDQRFVGGEYIPHASTWLNAKGWMDEHVQDIPKPATSAAYGQQPRKANSNRNGADHATHQRPDNSAPAKVARAIAERDSARQPAGPGVPPDDFIELGSGDYWAVAY